jgi:1-acyl-sn-glycerol-3-phosphate acyltransferase
MFYHFVRNLVATLIWLINGKITYLNRDKLPTDGNYVLVGPHRTWWDPIWYALAAYPKQFIFMAKIELFKFKPLGWFISKVGAFPVDRKNVGPSVIKVPVKALKNDDRALIMFPSGSRHSSELKSGALLIARMAGVPIIPAVYQGPVRFRDLFKRNNTTVAFGKPIIIDRKTKLDDAAIAVYTAQMQAAFDQLDHHIDPNWRYVNPKSRK